VFSLGRLLQDLGIPFFSLQFFLLQCWLQLDHACRYNAADIHDALNNMYMYKSLSVEQNLFYSIKLVLYCVCYTGAAVHGECLFTAIWTCYTIFLTTKSPVNQATAKATLTQMISIVLRRMEPDKQILRADASLQSNQTTAIREEAEPPASTSNHLVPPKALSNGNTSHQKRADAVEEGGSILIDTETGEARNASTGETMEMPNSSTPVVEAPPTSLYDLHQLALDADIKVAFGGHNLFI
jgi:hypothetical protein